MVLCPSGISDITRRTKINNLLVANEGTYLKNLERPVRVTHLLCSGDEETEKMRYAEKFNSRGEAKIHLVWEEWFWDSLDFGGRFDEARYDVRRPRPERKTIGEGISIFVIQTTILECLDLNDQVSSAPPSSEEPQPHQNTILDDMEDERAFANVLPDATLLLWSKLLERRGYQITDGEVILSPSKVNVPPPNDKKSDLPSRPNSPHHHVNGSVISSLRRCRPLLEKQPETTEIVREDEASSSRSRPAPSDNSSMIFMGMVFRALGEAKCPNVRQAINELGGRMSTDEDEDVDFIIVRLVR